MTATDIAKELTKANGGPFIKVGVLAKFVGDSNRGRVKKKYLEGLQQFNGNYFIPEVAERIKEHMTVV